MHHLLLTPLAPFFELDFALDFLLVFATPIVDTFTFGTSQFD